MSLKKLAIKNEARIDNHSGFKMTPPYYYDSLRHAYLAYFSTFQTNNSIYDYYAEGMSAFNSRRTSSTRLIDDENTVLSLIGFQRFFELFFKDLLSRVNPKLAHKPKSNYRTLDVLLKAIEEKTFVSNKIVGQYEYIPFGLTINRFYQLIELSKTNDSTPIVSKFRRLIKKYALLDSMDFREVLETLNWYRNKILHNGSRIPNQWFLDYFITQKISPIVFDLVSKEKDKLGMSLFYFNTVTGIDILSRLTENRLKFKFEDLSDETKAEQIFIKLLYIGHLKELGRANFNMNFATRNGRATYEYNYNDNFGRGKRFALAEQQHEDFKEIKKCTCCGSESLVVYSKIIDSVISIPSKKLDIQWVKCYTCHYHIRYNVGDPVFFDLQEEPFFVPNPTTP